jgi:hypothetical protein
VIGGRVSVTDAAIDPLSLTVVTDDALECAPYEEEYDTTLLWLSDSLCREL